MRQRGSARCISWPRGQNRYAGRGWSGSKDGPLPKFAEQNFDVFVTIDGTLERQNKLSALKLGVVIAHVPNNKLASYEPLFRQLNAAAEKVTAGEVVHPRRMVRLHAPAVIFDGAGDIGVLLADAHEFQAQGVD